MLAALLALPAAAAPALVGSPYGGWDISADGRWVVLASYDADLVPGDTNGVPDVFLYDRLERSHQRVSQALDGTQGSACSSLSPSISADGRWVIFYSCAQGLLGPQAPNTYIEGIFAYDRDADADGELDEPGEVALRLLRPAATPSDVSGDGRYVVYLRAFTPRNVEPVGYYIDVFLLDRDADEDGAFDETTELAPYTEPILVTGDLAYNGSHGDSMEVRISDDGSTVVFASESHGILPELVYGASSIYAYDVATGARTRLSPTSSGAPAAQYARRPSVSADGRFVSFVTDRPVAPEDQDAAPDYYVLDRQTGAFTRAPQEPEYQTNYRSYSQLTPDGSAVCYDQPINFISAGIVCMRLSDLSRSRPFRTRFAQPASGLNPALSADGSVVAYGSYSRLTVDDLDDGFDLYVDAPGEPDTVVTGYNPYGAIYAGEARSFGFTVYNAGATPAGGVVASGTLAAAASTITGAWVTPYGQSAIACASDADGFQCPPQTVAQAAPLTVSIAVAHGVGESLLTGDVTSTDADATPEDDFVALEAEALPMPQVDLSLAASTPKLQVERKKKWVINLSVTNQSAAASEWSYVSVSMPAGTVLVSGSVGGKACTGVGGTLECHVGAIPAGATLTGQIYFKNTLKGLKTFLVQAHPGRFPDPDATDNAVTLTKKVVP